MYMYVATKNSGTKHNQWFTRDYVSTLQDMYGMRNKDKSRIPV
jgi:hypothetical protein